MRILYRCGRWVTIVTIWLMMAAVVFAQSPVVKRIDGTHMCRSCVLRVDKVVRLSDPGSGMGRFMNLASIDRDSRGRYWVAVYGSHTNVLVFAPDGRVVKRIGREGAGPGEFRRVERLLVGPGDTVHAFDAGLNRRSEISPTTLEIVGQYPIAQTFLTTVMLANGNFVGGSSIADFTGHPFEEVDRNGGRVRSFGGDGKRMPSSARLWATRLLASDLRGGFYSLPRVNYSIEHWDASGRLTGRWERHAPWFPYREAQHPWESPPTRPDIFAVWVNADGLLFVGSHVRQERWEKGVGDVPAEGGRMIRGVVDRNAYYDSIIEVIDPKTSRLVAAIRSDLAFTWVAANGEIYLQGEDDEYFDIYRMTFTRR